MYSVNRALPAFVRGMPRTVVTEHPDDGSGCGSRLPDWAADTVIRCRPCRHPSGPRGTGRLGSGWNRFARRILRDDASIEAAKPVDRRNSGDASACATLCLGTSYAPTPSGAAAAGAAFVEATLPPGSVPHGPDAASPRVAGDPAVGSASGTTAVVCAPNVPGACRKSFLLRDPGRRSSCGTRCRSADAPDRRLCP